MANDKSKIIRVSMPVHRFLKGMAANSGFKTINAALEQIIKNLNRPRMKSGNGGEPL